MAIQDMQAKLSMDGKEFGEEIKSAKQRVQELGQQFGVGETKLVNFKKQVRDAKRDFADLSATYAKLSDELKNSDYGKAMAREIDAAKQKLAQLTDAQADFNREIKNMASDTAAWDSIKEGISSASAAMSAYYSVASLVGGENEKLANLIKKLAAVQSIANAAIALGNALQKQSALSNGIRMMADYVDKIGKVTTAKKLENAETQNEINQETKAAQKKGILARAQEMLTSKYTKLGIVMGGLAVAFNNLMSSLDRARDNAEKAQKSEDAYTKSVQERQDAINSAADEMGQAIGSVMANYQMLQKSFRKAKAAGDNMTEWANEHAQALNAVGVEQHDMQSLEDVFNNKTEAFVKAMKARTMATVYQTRAMKLYGDSLAAMDKQTFVPQGYKHGDKYYDNTFGSNYKEDYKKKYGLTESDFIETKVPGVISIGGDWKLTQSGLDKINKQINQKESDRLMAQAEAAMKEAEKQTDEFNKFKKENPDLFKSGNKTTTKKTTATKHEKTEYEVLSDANKKYAEDMQDIAKKRQMNLYDETDAEQNSIKAREAAISATEKLIDAYVKAAKGTNKYDAKIAELTQKVKDEKQEIIALGDKKTIQEAEKQYAEALVQISREKELGMIDEKQETDKLQTAMSNLCTALLKVTELTPELKKRIKAITSDIQNSKDAVDVQKVRAMITDFQKQMPVLNTQGKFDYRQPSEFYVKQNYPEKALQAKKSNGWLGDMSNWNMNFNSNYNVAQDVKSVYDMYTRTTSLDAYEDKLQEILNLHKQIQDNAGKILASDEFQKLGKAEQDAFIKGVEEQEKQLEQYIISFRDKFENELKFQFKVEGVENALSQINSISNAIKNVGSYIEGWRNLDESWDKASSWERFTIVMEKVIGTVELFNTALGVANTIHQIATTMSVENAAAKSAEVIATTEEAATETAAIAPKAAALAANKALEQSYLALAAAELFAAHAEIPFAGVGIATGQISAMFAAMAGAEASAAALGAFANGGIVGGGSYHGDKILTTALNSGEMVLNKTQQSNLFRLLDGNVPTAGNSGQVEFKLRGQELVGLIKNYNGKVSKLR